MGKPTEKLSGTMTGAIRMRVTLSVGESPAGGADGELLALYRWLRAEPLARRFAQVELGRSTPVPPDDMGGMFDLISLVLGSTFNAALLAVSIAQWRATRPNGGSLVRCSHDDGVPDHPNDLGITDLPPRDDGEPPSGTVPAPRA